MVVAKMNGGLVLTCLMIVVALLHTSLGATPQLRVTYSLNGMDDQVSLECRERPSGLLRSGATYTFKEPGTGRTEYSDVAIGSQSYTFTIHPSNESLVTCMLDSGESDPVMVAGKLMQVINRTFISQIQLNCDLQLQLSLSTLLA